jgi:hypothetical protein
LSELSGSLTDFPLREVFRLLESGTKTGILVVEGAEVRGSIFFRAGRMLFATTRRAAEANRATDRDRRRPSDADEREILASVVMRLLQLTDGSFIFQSDAAPVHPVTGSHSVMEIQEEAERRLVEWQALEAAVGSMSQPYALEVSTDSATDVVLTPEEWQVVATVGGGSSVHDVAVAAALPEVEVARCFQRLIERKLLVSAPADDIPARDGIDSSVDHEHAVVETDGGWTRDVAPPIMRGRGDGYQQEPPRSDGVVLDLTTEEERVAAGPAPGDSEVPEDEPVSELARRWRDLRRGVRSDDET